MEDLPLVLPSFTEFFIALHSYSYFFQDEQSFTEFILELVRICILFHLLSFKIEKKLENECLLRARRRGSPSRGAAAAG